MPGSPAATPAWDKVQLITFKNLSRSCRKTEGDALRRVSPMNLMHASLSEWAGTSSISSNSRCCLIVSLNSAIVPSSTPDSFLRLLAALPFLASSASISSKILSSSMGWEAEEAAGSWSELVDAEGCRRRVFRVSGAGWDIWPETSEIALLV